ncbi:MAG: MiaB/RimO family radical SAM methylthiotransferase [Anaerolineales bacterium]|nr:MiaB/RimO family radical SAM methylthiotransferase [Anaerolineales bacterium]
MKVYLDTIGCRLNQSEIERIARQFRSAGHEIVAAAADADLAVVNTCTVTVQAASDSRSKIRQISRQGVAEIYVTGCWSELEPEKACLLPGVRQVISNNQKERLVETALGLESDAFGLEPLSRELLPGLRQRTRAFIKVQDGCDNRCTFCITTIARGTARSVSETDVLSDIQYALDGGTQEVVLTGVHLGSWGSEWGMHLSTLVKSILDNTDVPRLRLSSLEPWDLTPEFFALWTDQRLCPYLHLPLQSGSATTLKRMVRKTMPLSYRKLVLAAREVIPGIAVTTDVIAGFPGETENEFLESLAFIREMEFAGGHVFTYSERPGTAAARMQEQVPHALRKERSAVLRAELAEAAGCYRRKFVSKVLPVLWETAVEIGPDEWLSGGLSSNYLRVKAYIQGNRCNRIDQVRITKDVDGCLSGDVVAVDDC